MGQYSTKTKKKAAWVITEKYCTSLGNEFHTSKRCVGETSPWLPTRSSATRSQALPNTYEVDSEGPSESVSPSSCRRKSKRGGTIMLRSRLIRRSLVLIDPDTKETLKLLDFGSLSNLQVTQFYPQISKHHMELFETFYSAAIFWIKFRHNNNKKEIGCNYLAFTYLFFSWRKSNYYFEELFKELKYTLCCIIHNTQLMELLVSIM